ncbi:hypothetical protein A6V39_04895 [Candidatus Mycoplasma haematobovis]|uniref:Uncharacterized protein n=1 Tax=Candidatus Mycoplasma haematobovis TaxID=432608 RepID=A0A1A9QDV9_9MOLU|nr:hypothetical protein [Candidatus Mycoplasma haematobovis]OAL09880.1 hypothetical protein A6V39_04895 [Candidatus Mycoplasma haematobovis]
MIKAKDRSRVIQYIKKAAEIQKALNECEKNRNHEEYSKLLAQQEELKNKLREIGATDAFINSTFKLLKKSVKFSTIMVKTFEVKPTNANKRPKMFSIEFIKYWKLSAFKPEERPKLIRILRTIALVQEIIRSLEMVDNYVKSKEMLYEKRENLKKSLKKLGAIDEFVEKTIELLEIDPRYCVDMVEIIRKGNVKARLN